MHFSHFHVETLFRRELVCALSHTRTLETHIKTVALHVYSPKRMIEPLFRREHAGEISHKRTFETPFKMGAFLVHSPQAHD